MAIKPTWKKAAHRIVRAPQNQPWGEKKIIAALAVGVFTAFALAAVGVFTVGLMVLSNDNVVKQTTAAADKDVLANKPMPTAGYDDAQPQKLAAGNLPTIRIPKPTTTGPAGVPSGFPQTPEGAVGQLAAISQTALTLSPPSKAQEVIKAWALPWGPNEDTWSAVKALAALRSSAKTSLGEVTDIQVKYTPMMAQIKGTVGKEFVVACINGELQASWRNTGRQGASDCQRMEWSDGRWMIAPGAEPAPAPDTWPGSHASIAMGWKEITHE